jgi:hypothetical protein
MKTVEKRGVFSEFEDHTLHLRHNDFVQITVEATDGATRYALADPGAGFSKT